MKIFKLSSVKLRLLMFVILGSLSMGLLQLHFVLFWHSYYSHFPWLGYSNAMAQGRVPPFFTTSPRSLWITKIALFIVPLVALWFARGRYWLSALAMWAGVMLSVMLIWLGTARLREDSNMWPIDLVYLSFMTAFPLFLGSAICLVIQKVLSYAVSGRATKLTS